jgi:hypothetical protein
MTGAVLHYAVFGALSASILGNGEVGFGCEWGWVACGCGLGLLLTVAHGFKEVSMFLYQ